MGGENGEQLLNGFRLSFWGNVLETEVMVT